MYLENMISINYSLSLYEETYIKETCEEEKDKQMEKSNIESE